LIPLRKTAAYGEESIFPVIDVKVVYLGMPELDGFGVTIGVDAGA
jgi:hypothetical protein